MSFYLKIYTKFFGVLVGTDVVGNRYFEHQKRTMAGKPRRWVLFTKHEEASHIPAAWHNWMHGNTPAPTELSNPWMKAHCPNQTGTSQHYTPENTKRTLSRDVIDYTPWNPNPKA